MDDTYSTVLEDYSNNLFVILANKNTSVANFLQKHAALILGIFAALVFVFLLINNLIIKNNKKVLQ